MTSPSSPLPSPSPGSDNELAAPLYTPREKEVRPGMWRHESAPVWGGHRQQDGYISFPDFEKFCQTREYESRDEHRHERTAVKT
jgi:hypothetical protein